MTSVDEIVPLLERVTLFQGLPREDLERMAAAGEERTIPAGEILFTEGEEGDAFFAILSGAVEILRSRKDGRPDRLAIRRAGESFGEMSLLDNALRSATARTIEETKVLVLDGAAFRSLLDPDSPAFRMLASLSRALRALDVRFTAQERAGAVGDGVRHFNALLRQGILPGRAPMVSGCDIAAGTAIAEGGAGDTAWDTFSLADGSSILAVYQVRGEGLPPAHQIAIVRALLHAHARNASTLDALLRETNESLTGVAIAGVDQSVECALLVPDGDTIHWASAGRCPGIHVKRGGGTAELPSSGPPLGVLPGFRYTARRIPIAPGDVALILSQGTPGLVRGAGDLVASLAGESTADAISAVHRGISRAYPAGTETSVVMVRREGA